MSIAAIRHYRIAHPLGAGAHGTAYLATDTVLMRPVVIKVLDRTSSRDGAPDRLLLEEARLASAIEHPNVCAIHEVGVHEGRSYIVMQYVAGRTLREVIEAGTLSLPLALSVGIQVADGLAAAHELGILHRDLKPANIMLGDDGRARILDFGLARRSLPFGETEAGAGSGDTGGAVSSKRFGTTAYMAPEQFLLRRSSEQTDVFALGVILYEMIAGRHPFVLPAMDPTLVPHAIQTRRPDPPSALRPGIPAALDEVVLTALARQTASRFRHAFELRDALRALMRDAFHETGLVPGEASAVLPTPLPAAEKPGLFAGLVSRILHPKPPRAGAEHAIAVLPFRDLDRPDETRAYGFAVGNAVAARLSRVPSLVVRPLSAYLAVSRPVDDPVEMARTMRADRALLGSYTRLDGRLLVHWQLLDAADGTLRHGGTLELDGVGIAAAQNQVAEQILAELSAAGELGDASTPRPAAGATLDDLPDDAREAYLEARALLASFTARSAHRDDLERALRRHEWVVERAPDFAPGHAGLGVALLRFARNGFGGVEHLLAAQRSLTRALELAPDLLEAKLYRASTLLWAGEKESARLDVQALLAAAPDNAEVCLAAGAVLLLDGLLPEALRLQRVALRLDPSAATRVYYYRARLLVMLGRLDEARQELDKGLAIEPGHTLLRNVLGYWHFYGGDLQAAIATLEGVVAQDPTLRIAFPTLAMCYARAGRADEAAALITEETRDAADADAEIAYRLATFHAVAGERQEALSWLRTAIVRGNENFPWFARNPAWSAMVDDPELGKIMGELEEVHRLNRPRWERVLASLRD